MRVVPFRPLLYLKQYYEASDDGHPSATQTQPCGCTIVRAQELERRVVCMSGRLSSCFVGPSAGILQVFPRGAMLATAKSSKNCLGPLGFQVGADADQAKAASDHHVAVRYCKVG